MKPRTLVLSGQGFNCAPETRHCFGLAGSDARIVQLDELFGNLGLFDEADILAVVGGFSYADDLGAGTVVARRLAHETDGRMQRFAESGKPIIGICNGFQALAKAGIIPNISGSLKQEATLMQNDAGRFDNRWIYMEPDEESPCIFTKGLRDYLLEHFAGRRLTLPIRHGEGRFFADKDVMEQLKLRHLIALRYALPDSGIEIPGKPYNPNGSLDDVAGICNQKGNVFGLMPHPEGFYRRTQHPRWTRPEYADLPEEGMGMYIFRKAVEYAKGL